MCIRDRTRSAASRSESTKGAQHPPHIDSAFRPRPDLSEDGNPKTGTREDQREPFLRPAAVNVRSTSRSFLGSVDSNGAAHGKKRPPESDSCFSLISRDWQDASAPVITFLCALRGSVHMGAGATALTRISFRVIPRFLSAQIADECATLSVLSVQRLKLPASCSPIETGAFKTAHAPRRMAARARQHSDLRTAQAEMPRNREVPRTRKKRRAPRPEPISARVATDLGAEVDRSRAGVRPISAS